MSAARRPLRPRRALVGALVFSCAFAAGPAPAQQAPQAGTAERDSPIRRDIMDALRPLAEWAFDPPVEFVVRQLRVAGDVAFAAVDAQRPGGAPIDLASSPLVRRDGEPVGLVDGPHLEALLQKSGAMWVPVHHAVGSSDVWYAWEGYCPRWGPVLPDTCH
jgi:hypothetical protein